MTGPTEATFDVAPDGSDANPGTRERPLATLARARDLLRELKSRSAGPMTVVVRAGTYCFDAPLVFMPEDSGTREAPITYQAEPGESVTLSGGRSLGCDWKPFRDGILMAELREGKTGRLDFGQLFVNGKRRIRARYPNQDLQNGLDRGCTTGAEPGEWPHTEFRYNPDQFTRKRWARPEEAVLHIFAMNRWGNMQWRVREIDWPAHTVRLGEGGWQLNEIYQRDSASRFDQRSPFYIENVFEELDAPGEWYLDRSQGVLYYLPEFDEDMARATVEAAALRQVVEIRGTRANPVRHLTLSGFRFAHTASVFLEPYEVPSMGDWSIHRGGAVFLEGAEDCAVEGCCFDAVGGNGVFINGHARRIRVHGNRFTEAGESAVCVVGKSHLNPNGAYRCPFCGAPHAWTWNTPTGEYPEECLISNNLIHDIGVFGKQTAGVFLSLTAKNTVSHNRIYNTPRAAICINDGQWGGHVIEFNDIHDTVRETGDHGPFNSWGRDRAWCAEQSHGSAHHPAGDVKTDAKFTTMIRNNRFRDYHGWGIDLDDGSSNYYVSDNLCIGVSIKLREGDYRTVENNIFINPANPPGIHVGFVNNSDRIVRNIIVTNTRFDNPEVDVNFQPGRDEGDSYQFIRPPETGPWMKEIDYNLFFNDARRFLVNGMDLEEWQEKGFDRHSLFADPLFVDPTREDFRLQPASPALKLGFRNFPMDKFGLTPDFPQWLQDEE